MTKFKKGDMVKRISDNANHLPVGTIDRIVDIIDGCKLILENHQPAPGLIYFDTSFKLHNPSWKERLK